MTRYFYTDPLAAAWMAKHFGMRFVPEEDFHNEIWGCGEPIKAFIHPDSLHLLEPKDGDFLFQIGGGGDPDLIVPFELADVANDRPIVTRNGIAFMWPESEAA